MVAATGSRVLWYVVGPSIAMLAAAGALLAAVAVGWHLADAPRGSRRYLRPAGGGRMRIPRRVVAVVAVTVPGTMVEALDAHRDSRAPTSSASECSRPTSTP